MTSLAIIARSHLRDQRTQKRLAKKQIVSVFPRPGNKQKGLLKIGSQTFRCALGRSGIGIMKKEGDGKTPLAKMKVLFGFFRADRWPISSRPYWIKKANHTLGWCDAPDDPNYNRAVNLPFAASHETLTRDDPLYDCVIVLGWNIEARSRNRGSAIFLHLARDGFLPTEGCIAVSKATMRHLILRIEPGTIITTGNHSKRKAVF